MVITASLPAGQFAPTAVGLTVPATLVVAGFAPELSIMATTFRAACAVVTSRHVPVALA